MNQVMRVICILGINISLITGNFIGINLAEARVESHNLCTFADVLNTPANTTRNSATYTTTLANRVIKAICVKLGDDQLDNGHKVYFQNGTFDDCYTVSGIETATISITKISNSVTCKDIAHLDVILKLSVFGTMPTQSASNTPTSISIEPTITPTITPKATLVPTPTTSNSAADSESTNDSSYNEAIGGITIVADARQTGAVISYADTGVFTDTLVSVGVMLSSLGYINIINTKRKSSRSHSEK